MTDEPPRPQWKTGVLWGILAVFVVVGAAGAAAFVYGLIAFVAGDPVGLLVGAVGAIGSLLAFLFTLGILYRVDRYRGVTARRVELFE
jgi:nitrate/nitrite transporter NarK